MFRSDAVRAAAALIFAAGTAAAVVGYAPELRASGLLPVAAEPPELVYTLINVTDELAARQACPLDLDVAKRRVEAGLGRDVRPVYSPIAEGADVLVHEVSARLDGSDCVWSAHTFLSDFETGPHADTPDADFSGLERASRQARPLLDAR
jgi:hypothetical protein